MNHDQLIAPRCLIIIMRSDQTLITTVHVVITCLLDIRMTVYRRGQQHDPVFVSMDVMRVFGSNLADALLS